MPCPPQRQSRTSPRGTPIPPQTPTPQDRSDPLPLCRAGQAPTCRRKNSPPGMSPGPSCPWDKNCRARPCTQSDLHFRPRTYTHQDTARPWHPLSPLRNKILAQPCRATWMRCRRCKRNRRGIWHPFHVRFLRGKSVQVGQRTATATRCHPRRRIQQNTIVPFRMSSPQDMRTQGHSRK